MDYGRNLHGFLFGLQNKGTFCPPGERVKTTHDQPIPSAMQTITLQDGA